MSLDLVGMSLSDLRKLQSDVAKAISGYEERKRREALLALQETAKNMGFELGELIGEGAPVKRARKPAAPKFAHPENAQVTWTGRGKQPAWFAAALKSGKTTDDLRIK